METIPLNDLEKTFSDENIPSVLHKRLFPQISPDDRSIIMQSEWRNGDLADFFDKYEVEGASILAKKKARLHPQQKHEEVPTKSVVTETAGPSRGDAWARSIILRDLIAGLYSIQTGTDKSYADILASVKLYHKERNGAFKEKFFALIGIKDATTRSEIEIMGIQYGFQSLFEAIPCKKYSRSSHIDAYARIFGIQYQMTFFPNITPLMTDADINRMLEVRKNEIISTAATSAHKVTGMPIEELQKDVRVYFASVLNDLQMLVSQTV